LPPLAAGIEDGGPCTLRRVLVEMDTDEPRAERCSKAEEEGQRAQAVKEYDEYIKKGKWPSSITGQGPSP